MNELYRNIKITLLFYRFTYLANITISMSCLWILTTHGWGTIGSLFWFKVIAFSIIAWHTEQVRNKEFYFFYNQGFSKRRLWYCVLAIDFLFLIFIIYLFFSYGQIGN